MEPARIRVATCCTSGEAALVRSILAAHEIPVAMSSEHHATLLGGFGGGLVSIDVWVGVEHAEAAAELLRQLREGTDALAPAEDDDADDCNGDTRGVGQELEARRATLSVLLFSLCLTFGLGHAYAGAYRHAFALAAIEVVGILQLFHNPVLGGAMIGSAVVTDAIGAMVRVRRDAAAQRLPRARIARIHPGDRV